MDLNDLWQENKRWILGCLLGVVVFWIGWSVVQSTWSSAGVMRDINRVRRKVAGEEHYTSEALAAARREAERLAEVKARLERALVFQPHRDFLLAGKGDPDLHWDAMSRRVRRALVRRADELGVDFSEANLEWSTYRGRDEYQAALIGLCLADQAVGRLLEAHHGVRAADFEAIGLAGIDSVKISGGRSLSGRRGARRRRTEDDGPLDEEKVRLEFRADEAVVKRFLEACRRESPPIAVSGFEAGLGKRPGDPLVVECELSAVRLRG